MEIFLLPGKYCKKMYDTALWVQTKLLIGIRCTITGYQKMHIRLVLPKIEAKFPTIIKILRRVSLKGTISDHKFQIHFFFSEPPEFCHLQRELHFINLPTTILMETAYIWKRRPFFVDGNQFLLTKIN